MNLFHRFLQLLVLCLVFSIAITSSSSVAGPKSRRLMFSKDQEAVSALHQYKDDGMMMEGGRMNMEIEDYPGTGANNHHDPKPPVP